MFETLEQAIAFGDKKNETDGGRPVFYTEAVSFKNPDGTVDFRDEIYVKIFNISDPKNVIVRPKRPDDEQRWPEHWKAYLENTEVQTDGTPIDTFPHFTPADRMKLKARHILSVEEVDELAENALKEIFGSKAFSTKKQVRQFLDYRQGDTAMLLKRIEELEAQLGNNTDDSSEHSGGGGTTAAIDADRERKPGRKVAKKASRKKRAKSG